VVVRLARPPVNAVDREMYIEIARMFSDPDQIETMDLKAGYEVEQSYTVKMSGHPDSQEALQSFRQKREPEYLALTGAQPPII
jgi:hypothetical protein